MHSALPLSPNQKNSHSIRRYLIILLLGLQFITVASIVAITQFSFNKDLQEQSNIILQNAVKESRTHTLDFLTPAYRNVQQTTALIENGVLDTKNTAALENYFLSLLEKNNELNSIYHADTAGNFFFVSRDTNKAQSKYLTKIIAAAKPGVASFLWRDKALTMTERQNDIQDEYQVKQRPWYTQVMEKQDLIWTEPYIFFTSKQAGVTVAMPYKDTQGNTQGAVGFDIELAELSEFFSELNIYGSTSAFMVSGTEKFIAAPSFTLDGAELNSLDFVNDNNIGDPIERFAANHLIKNFSKIKNENISGKFSYNNEDYNVRYESFTITDGPEWIISAYAPSNSFLEKLVAHEKRNIMVAVIVLLLSMIVGVFFIRRTWQPFDKLFSLIVVDQLTGLYNRSFLEGIGSTIYLQNLRNQNKKISIAAIDIDFFDRVNNEFGKSVGDKAIEQFSNFLKSVFNEENIITRYGGDNFVIIFIDEDSESVEFTINNTRLKLDAWPLTVDDLLIRLTFSAGIITIDASEDIESEEYEDNFSYYVKQARLALQQAKANGRDCVVVGNSSPLN